MSAKSTLPFDRGSIWHANTAVTGGNNGMPGSTWNSTDFDRPIDKRHGFMVDEELVVLRNRSGSAIDRTDGGKFFRLSSASSQAFGCVGGAAARGGSGFALDDCYTGTGVVPHGCDAYFVKKGLTRVRCHTTPGTITAYTTRLRIATNGHVSSHALTTGTWGIVGVAANSTATGGANLLVLVGYDVPLP